MGVGAEHRCLLPVVGLGHLRSVADLEQQLPLRVEVVRHQRLQLSDLVQQQQLRAGVIPQISDDGADHAQFVCATCAPSLEFPGRDRVNVNLSFSPPEQVPVNSLPLSESIPSNGNGSSFSDVDKRSQHPFLSLVLHRSVLKSTRSRYRDGQRVAMIADRVAALMPTRSISTRPGAASSHCAHVRIGIDSFNNDPGFVSERHLTCNFARSCASRRSIVASDIAINANSMSSLILSSSNRRRRHQLRHHRRQRLPVGAPNTAQQNASATTTSAPCSGTQATRGRTSCGFSANRTAFRA